MTATTLSFVPGPPRLAVRHAGEGQLILFLHGIGGNKLNWDDQLLAFGSEMLAAAWDARGYGDSDPAEEPFEYDAYVEDVLRCMKFFGASKLHLVGLSMGGRIAMEFSARYPHLLHSLCIANSSPGLTTFTAEEKAEFLRLRRAPLLAGRTPADMAPELAQQILGRSPSPEARERILDSLRALHPASYLRAIEVNMMVPAFDAFVGGRFPTLFISSDEDRLATPAVAETMAKMTPGSEVSIISNAGHLSNIEQPERFNATLMQFLMRNDFMPPRGV